MADFDMASFMLPTANQPGGNADEPMNASIGMRSTSSVGSVSRMFPNEDFKDDPELEFVSKITKKNLGAALQVAERRAGGQMTWHLLYDVLETKCEELVDAEGEVYDQSVVKRVEAEHLDQPCSVKECLQTVARALIRESKIRQFGTEEDQGDESDGEPVLVEQNIFATTNDTAVIGQHRQRIRRRTVLLEDGSLAMQPWRLVTLSTMNYIRFRLMPSAFPESETLHSSEEGGEEGEEVLLDYVWGNVDLGPAFYYAVVVIIWMLLFVLGTTVSLTRIYYESTSDDSMNSMAGTVRMATVAVLETQHEMMDVMRSILNETTAVASQLVRRIATEDASRAVGEAGMRQALVGATEGLWPEFIGSLDLQQRCMVDVVGFAALTSSAVNVVQDWVDWTNSPSRRTESDAVAEWWLTSASNPLELMGNFSSSVNSSCVVGNASVASIAPLTYSLTCLRATDHPCFTTESSTSSPVVCNVDNATRGRCRGAVRNVNAQGVGIVDLHVCSWQMNNAKDQLMERVHDTATRWVDKQVAQARPECQTAAAVLNRTNASAVREFVAQLAVSKANADVDVKAVGFLHADNNTFGSHNSLVGGFSLLVAAAPVVSLSTEVSELISGTDFDDANELSLVFMRACEAVNVSRRLLQDVTRSLGTSRSSSSVLQVDMATLEAVGNGTDARQELLVLSRDPVVRLPIIEARELARAASGETGTAVSVSLDGEPAVLGFTHIPELGVGLLLQLPEEAANGHITDAVCRWISALGSIGMSVSADLRGALNAEARVCGVPGDASSEVAASLGMKRSLVLVSGEAGMLRMVSLRFIEWLHAGMAISFDAQRSLDAISWGINYAVIVGLPIFALLCLGLFVVMRLTVKDSEHEFIVYKGSIEREKDRFVSLVKDSVPYYLQRRVEQGERLLIESADRISVGVVDVVGMTEIWTQPSQQVILSLGYLMMVEDGVANYFALHKLTTVGDAYICVGGLPENSVQRGVRWKCTDDTHMYRMVSFAATLQMLFSGAYAHHPGETPSFQKYMEENGLLHKNKKPLPIPPVRIGIHCGPAKVGIVDVNKAPFFDVYGSCVPMAIRMESTAQAGRIQLSSAARSALRDQDAHRVFDFAPSAKKLLKGMGTMTTYTVRATKLTVPEEIVEWLGTTETVRHRIHATEGLQDIARTELEAQAKDGVEQRLERSTSQSSAVAPSVLSSDDGNTTDGSAAGIRPFKQK